MPPGDQEAERSARSGGWAQQSLESEKMALRLEPRTRGILLDWDAVQQLRGGPALLPVAGEAELLTSGDKALEGLTHLVRFAEDVHVVQVCHDHRVLGCLKEGRVEGQGKEEGTERVTLLDAVSRGDGITSNHEQT